MTSSNSLTEIYLDNNATTRPLPEVIETVAVAETVAVETARA